MDLRLRALLHRHLQRAPLLLRHVLPLQRRRPPLLPTRRLLEILDVLRQPGYVLDRRRPSRHSPKFPRPMQSRGNGAV